MRKQDEIATIMEDCLSWFSTTTIIAFHSPELFLIILNMFGLVCEAECGSPAFAHGYIVAFLKKGTLGNQRFNLIQKVQRLKILIQKHVHGIYTVRTTL